MTEKTIKALAMELAGQFYEAKRSDRFRSKNSLTRAKTIKRLPNGQLAEVTVTVPFFTAYPTAKKFALAHWPFWIDTARKCLTTMLALPDARIHPNMKDAISEALIEDRQKEYKGKGKRLIQRGLEV